jgi:hypothetical protein
MAGQLGSLSQIEYFVKRSTAACRDSHPIGFHILAPMSNARCPEGYTREYADSLSAVDRLQTILLRQERQEWERERIHEESLIGARQRAVVDRLKQKMVSSSTSPYERDFIAAWLQLREEKKEKYNRIFEQRVAYLSVLAKECPPGRKPNEERVNLDRMELPRE